MKTAPFAPDSQGINEFSEWVQGIVRAGRLHPFDIRAVDCIHLIGTGQPATLTRTFRTGCICIKMKDGGGGWTMDTTGDNNYEIWQC